MNHEAAESVYGFILSIKPTQDFSFIFLFYWYLLNSSIEHSSYLWIYPISRTYLRIFIIFYVFVFFPKFFHTGGVASKMPLNCQFTELLNHSKDVRNQLLDSVFITVEITAADIKPQAVTSAVSQVKFKLQLFPTI